MKYNFDEIIDRRNTNSEKWDLYPADVLPMWVADSDFKCPQPVIDTIAAMVQRGVFGYTMDDGEFEKAYAGWAARHYGWQADASWVEWCPSLGTALALVIRTFSKPGDNVAMLTPIYPPFTTLCGINDRTALGSELKPDAQGVYRVDFEDLEKKLADPRTSLFLLCSPHNPTGRAFSREELSRMGELCVKHNVIVFSDEIHADLIYNGEHTAFPALSPEIAEITLVGMNASKTFNLADLRAAAVLSSSERLLQAFAAERNRCKLGRCSLGVAGVTAAYTRSQDYLDQIKPYIEANMRHAVEFINGSIPGVKTYMPEATYLLWLDCRELCAKLGAQPGSEQETLNKFMLEKAKVALNSGASFGASGTGFLRLNLACPRALVDEGLGRIKRAVEELK